MKKLTRMLALACMMCAGYVGGADATSYDYGDAPGYQQAKHSTDQWQTLGTLWSNEPSQRSEDNDDGVAWSLDNGNTWGHDTVTNGQAVWFRFEMHKKLWGRHLYDGLKVWIDWNQDEDFTDTDEKVYQDAWYFRQAPGYRYGDDVADISRWFYMTLEIPEDALLGETWLRARVTCDESIGGNLDNMDPTGYLWQGEVEDWKLKIEEAMAPPASIPEPSTMLLLGIGLGSAALFGRRNRK